MLRSAVGSGEFSGMDSSAPLYHSNDENNLLPSKKERTLKPFIRRSLLCGKYNFYISFAERLLQRSIRR
jgi:hypothetical protein